MRATNQVVGGSTPSGHTKFVVGLQQAPLSETDDFLADGQVIKYPYIDQGEPNPQAICNPPIGL